MLPPHPDLATRDGFLPNNCIPIPIMVHLNTYVRLINRGLYYHSMYGHSLCSFSFFSMAAYVWKFEFSHSGIISEMGRIEKN